jgi:hypothetical protein
MTDFLSVKEAAAQVGKSPSSIRRIIYPIIEDDAHPDCDQIWPSVDEVKTLRMKGESFPWKLSPELLRREVPAETATERGEASARHAASSAEGELLSMLRRELDIKNQQISQQADLISKQADLVSGLSERLREGNVLMATLQQRLALGDGRVEQSVEAVATKPTKTKAEKPEKGSAKSDKVRKRFFPRLW